MSLSIAIVGLPNVGKSTLFNALTKSSILAANYPFATIEPNVGIVPVQDARLDTLARISKSKKIVPASVKFVDVAGLVRGAAEGAGLGNKFLSHVRECGTIAQVVRVFDDSNVTHVDSSVDPARDIETILIELCLADLLTVQKQIEKLSAESKTNQKLLPLITQLRLAESTLDENKPLHTLDRNLVEDLYAMQFLTLKPFIYVFNLDEQSLANHDIQEKLTKLTNGAPCVFLSAKIEAELIDMDVEDKNELLESIGQKTSGLVALAHLGYDALNLQSFYTSGEQESRAWTVHKNATAPEAAGVIHTDFERGFIKADIVSFDDFVKFDGWVGARNAGKVRLEGRDYVMQPDDVVEFKFNV